MADKIITDGGAIKEPAQKQYTNTGISDSIVNFNDPRAQAAVKNGMVFADSAGGFMPADGGLVQPIGATPEVGDSYGTGGPDLLQRKRNALEILLKKYE